MSFFSEKVLKRPPAEEIRGIRFVRLRLQGKTTITVITCVFIR